MGQMGFVSQPNTDSVWDLPAGPWRITITCETKETRCPFLYVSTPGAVLKSRPGGVGTRVTPSLGLEGSSTCQQGRDKLLLRGDRDSTVERPARTQTETWRTEEEDRRPKVHDATVTELICPKNPTNYRVSRTDRTEK